MLTPNHNHEIPEMTVKVAKAALPLGNAVMRIRDELGPLFEDGEFTAMYPSIGQPAESPARLAQVTVLQFKENLPDREAADAVRSRIDLKYALGAYGPWLRFLCAKRVSAATTRTRERKHPVRPNIRAMCHGRFVERAK